MTNPYEVPESDMSTSPQERAFEYVGFWRRVAASIVDSILMMMIIVPVMMGLYGKSYYLTGESALEPVAILFNYILPAAVVLLFWIYKSATPGKMAVNAQIVDAKTGLPASKGQLIGRYLGYYLSGIILGLGFLWVAFDSRKQGWHDKLAGTVVIRYVD